MNHIQINISLLLTKDNIRLFKVYSCKMILQEQYFNIFRSAWFGSWNNSASYFLPYGDVFSCIWKGSFVCLVARERVNYKIEYNETEY